MGDMNNNKLQDLFSGPLVISEKAFVDDPHLNSCGVVPSSSGEGHIADTTNPNLLNFDLDMDNAELKLYFDETIDASTLNPSAISLHHSINEGQSRASNSLVQLATP